jgi:C4-type Zn-finger protein
MRRFAHTLVAGLLFISFAGTAAHATHKSTKKTKKATTMKCPKCGMMMSSMKTAKTPAMMKVNGKTWYCCEACGKAEASTKGHKAQ